MSEPTRPPLDMTAAVRSLDRVEAGLDEAIRLVTHGLAAMAAAPPAALPAVVAEALTATDLARHALERASAAAGAAHDLFDQAAPRDGSDSWEASWKSWGLDELAGRLDDLTGIAVGAQAALEGSRRPGLPT